MATPTDGDTTSPTPTPDGDGSCLYHDTHIFAVIRLLLTASRPAEE